MFAARCRPTVPPSLALPVDTSQDSDSSSSSSASTGLLLSAHLLPCDDALTYARPSRHAADGFQAMPAVLPPGPEPDSDDDAALAPVCAPTPTSELHPPQRILIFLPAVDSQEPVVARCTEVAVPPGCDWAVLSEAIADSADAADHSDAAAWLRAGCAELCLSQASEGSDLLSLLSVPLSSADGQAFWALSSLADAGGSRRGFLVRRKTDRTPPDRAPADEALSLLMSLDLSRRPADEESDTEAHDGEEVQAESPADQPTPLKVPTCTHRCPCAHRTECVCRLRE